MLRHPLQDFILEAEGTKRYGDVENEEKRDKAMRNRNQHEVGGLEAGVAPALLHVIHLLL